jgi:hypothetical protein
MYIFGKLFKQTACDISTIYLEHFLEFKKKKKLEHISQNKNTILKENLSNFLC